MSHTCSKNLPNNHPNMYKQTFPKPTKSIAETYSKSMFFLFGGGSFEAIAKSRKAKGIPKNHAVPIEADGKALQALRSVFFNVFICLH